MTVLGIISDTHGMLRPEAVEALRGSTHILHAGDVGTPEILERLREIAPVTAVRGNVDRGAWASVLPESEVVEIEGVSIFMLHVLAELDLKPQAAGFGVVVYGHSHKPVCEVKGGVLYFNPGSAGPRRFKLPVTVGRLTLDGGVVRGAIVVLGE
jgi:putative phosphoesterase